MTVEQYELLTEMRGLLRDLRLATDHQVMAPALDRIQEAIDNYADLAGPLD